MSQLIHAKKNGNTIDSNATVAIYIGIPISCRFDVTYEPKG